MPTFVAMLNWSGARPDDVRAAVAAHSCELRDRGLHSLVFLPDEGACAAIMVAAAHDDAAVAAIAGSILPHADVRIDSMRFDDDPSVPARSSRQGAPPPSGQYLLAVLDAVVAQ